MRTIEITVYSFDELNDSAKEKAKTKYFENESFDWIWSDVISTIKEFCKRTDVSTSRNSLLEPSFSNIDDAILELSGERLMAFLYNNFDFLWKRKYVKMFDGHKEHRNVRNKTTKSGKEYCTYYSSIFVSNDCVLTGMCYDDDFLKPIYDFLEKPTERIDFKSLIEDCFDSLKHAVESEIEYYLSMDYFKEYCVENNLEFDEKGNRI